MVFTFKCHAISGKTLTATKGFKYGAKGLHSEENLEHLNLPTSMKEALTLWLNHSLASGTWSTYKTVGNQLEKCQEETKEKMDFPLDTRRIITFIHLLFHIRKVKSSTVNTYLSGIRYLHLSKGVDIPALRPPLVEQLLKGKQNLENIEKQLYGNPTRAPVTLTVMKLIKAELKDWLSNRTNKALVWSVCTLAFAGCLRIHEILCKQKLHYDPDFSLLGADFLIKSISYKNGNIKSIQLKLKSPKEDRIGTGKIIDVYESSGPLCLVRALE